MQIDGKLTEEQKLDKEKIPAPTEQQKQDKTKFQHIRKNRNLSNSSY